MEVLEELDNLRLDCLDEAWVQGIYYSEFLEFGEIPAEYERILESLEIRSVFKKIMGAFDRWLASESTEEKSWAALCHQVEHEKLLALLAYYIDYGSKNVVTKEFRNNALLASRMYYKLLSVPGYKAYNIYHSQLFAQSLACLGYPKLMCDNDNNYLNTRDLTKEVNSVIRELRPYVIDLRAIIAVTLQLNPNDMNFEDIVSNLVDITGCAIVNRLNVDKIELANITRVIYEMIDILINNEDGPDPVVIKIIYKSILPKLVAASVDSKNSNNLVRASYVTYSGLLLTKYGKAALSGYMVLLQHLCYTVDGIERAEVRTARVSLVMGLMSLLPRKSYRKIVKWLLQLSTTAKVSHRQIALEMFANLLNNEPEDLPPIQPDPEPERVLEESGTVSENQQEITEDSNNKSSENTSEIGADTNDNSKVDSGTKDVESSNKVADDEDSNKEAYIVGSVKEPCNGGNIKDVQENSTKPGTVFENENLTKEDDMTIISTENKEIDAEVTNSSTDVDMDETVTENDSLTKEVDMVSPDVENKEINEETTTPMNIDNTVTVAKEGDLNVVTTDSAGLSSPVNENPTATNTEVTTVMNVGKSPNIKLKMPIIVLEKLQLPLENPPDISENLLQGLEIPLDGSELPNISDLLDNDDLFSGIDNIPEVEPNAAVDQSNKTELLSKEASNSDANKTESPSNKLDPQSNKSSDNKEENPQSKKATTENKGQNENDVATEDESSQDMPTVDNDDITEEDVAGLLRQRPHSVPYLSILRAVYARAHDASGTLRTRAALLLAECAASRRKDMQRAVKELNGEGEATRLMATAAKCVCDERAAVRRAGVTLVHKLLTVGSEPTLQDLQMLISLCRDASILVRSAAISSLGELLGSRQNDAVFDAFLLGPMHQLSDPENKVQEQVVQLIQSLVIDRLDKYSPFHEEPTPWRFLSAVIRHNMRRHLQLACDVLAKTSKCISHRVVDLLSTHLGTKDDKRDLECLVLLTCVARHVDYTEINFVLDYYYKLAEETEVPRDVRLTVLTLELSGAWARFAHVSQRVALRDHLVKRLANCNDAGCRIECANLAANLDPNNLVWATELMQLLERRAVNGGDLDEWLRAADLSLVADTAASALPKLFVSAVEAPPPAWSDARLGACVAGLGRLCVRARGVAAVAAPALAGLLSREAPLCARVNALLALTDICTRYTCIVEPHLTSICGCLLPQTDAPLRRAAARALTKLFLGGFLRLRTPLYYKYCALIADDDADVREPAEYYVTSCLTADTIYHHFVDCILHYNTDDNTDTISFDSRQLIYDVMLQRLSLVQKLNVQCRIAREVLEHAADVADEGDIPEALNAALLDAITLLIGPRMKLPRKPEKNSGDADIDDLQERITTNIVSHKMKSTVAEVLVPAVLRLYSRLRAGGGQLAAYLVRIANDLLVDYRQEIEELIENDEELVDRIQQFQENIGTEPSFGNSRNLVTASTAAEPDTPRAPRRRAPRHHTEPKKRRLRI